MSRAPWQAGRLVAHVALYGTPETSSHCDERTSSGPAQHDRL